MVEGISAMKVDSQDKYRCIQCRTHLTVLAIVLLYYCQGLVAMINQHHHPPLSPVPSLPSPSLVALTFPAATPSLLLVHLNSN